MSGSWLLVLLAGMCAGDTYAQSRRQGQAEGTLTVRATVVSSSTVVVGEDGKLRVVVANAPAEEITALTAATEANLQTARKMPHTRPLSTRSHAPRNKDAIQKTELTGQ